MGRESNFRQRLAEIFDLPQEVILDLPLISIVGNLNLKVENHRGIIKYTPELVEIKIKRGQLIIEGRQLNIEQIKKEKVVVVGKIDNLSFKLF